MTVSYKTEDAVFYNLVYVYIYLVAQRNDILCWAILYQEILRAFVGLGTSFEDGTGTQYSLSRPTLFLSPEKTQNV
jgi:hypothetical protein